MERFGQNAVVIAYAGLATELRFHPKMLSS
jgi:hypothetical protein